MGHSPGQSPRRPPWYAWPLLPFAAPVGLALLLIVLLLLAVALLSIPFAMVMGFLQTSDERRFRRLMKRHNRFVEWADLAPVLMRGEGTLIIEQAHKRPVRVWWTPENVLDLAPCPPPGEDELDLMGLRPDAPHGFVRWCHRRYTSEDAGRALNTLPSGKFPPGLAFGWCFRGAFAQLRVIDTVCCRGDESLTAARRRT